MVSGEQKKLTLMNSKYSRDCTKPKMKETNMFIVGPYLKVVENVSHLKEINKSLKKVK